MRDGKASARASMNLPVLLQTRALTRTRQYGGLTLPERHLYFFVLVLIFRSWGREGEEAGSSTTSRST